MSIRDCEAPWGMVDGVIRLFVVVERVLIVFCMARHSRVVLFAHVAMGQRHIVYARCTTRSYVAFLRVATRIVVVGQILIRLSQTIFILIRAGSDIEIDPMCRTNPVAVRTVSLSIFQSTGDVGSGGVHRVGAGGSVLVIAVCDDVSVGGVVVSVRQSVAERMHHPGGVECAAGGSTPVVPPVCRVSRALVFPWCACRGLSPLGRVQSQVFCGTYPSWCVARA